MCEIASILRYMYISSFHNEPFHPPQEPLYPLPLCMESLEEIFSGCADFEVRRIDLGLENRICVHVCWLDGTVLGTELSASVIRPLTQTIRSGGCRSEADALRRAMLGGVYSCAVKKCTDCDSTVYALTHGHCAVVFDRAATALCFEVRSTHMRAVGEPTLEKTLKGAKDAFTENLRVNTFLLRRRLSSPKLKIVESSIGRKSETRVALLFLDGVASPRTVEELGRRLDRLDVDALLALGILEEKLSDHPACPFPQFLHTERADRLAMYLSDGRVGLLVDGIPVALVLPVSFSEFMKVTGDGSMHYLVSSAITLLRYLALILSATLPAFYVAVAMYHQELIPTKLLLSIIEAKQNVPFSTAIEVLGMIIAFGLLQEAGLRLPNPIGDTVSIIGALIVGQSAVEARVISPIAIIVVALSGIACYALPSQDMGYAVRLLRFVLVLAAIVAGLYGVGLFMCFVIFSLSAMDSFGVNYTAPLSDGLPGGLLRLLLRGPKSENKYRDPSLDTPDSRRQK